MLLEKAQKLVLDNYELYKYLSERKIESCEASGKNEKA
jgi:hypothetical protein